MSIMLATQGRMFVCRLNFDSDLLDSIREIAEEKGVKSATFTAIGAVNNAVVGFYDQKEKKYRDLTLDKPLEVLNCSGNVGILGEQIIVHAHITLSDVEGQAYGGHLMKGTRVFAIELVMKELTGIELVREFDPVTGLNLIKLPEFP